MSQLVGTHRADAVIVGSSLTGLLLGSALAASSMKTAIIDPSDVPDSSVSVTATVLCTDRYEKIAAVHGVDAAHQYAAALQAQLHTLLSSPPPYVQEIPVYTYACSDAEGRLLEQQRALLNQLGISTSTAPDAGGCPFPVELSLATPSQAAVNLTQWQSALKSSIRQQGGCIYADRLITFIGNERVCTVRGSVEAQHVILTTGIPPGLRSKRLLALLESRLQVHCRLTSPFPLHSGQQSVLADGLRLTPSASGIFASWDAGRLGTRTQARHHAAMLQRLPRRMPDYPANELQYRQIVYPMDGLPFIGMPVFSGGLATAFWTPCLPQICWPGACRDAFNRRIRFMPRNAPYPTHFFDGSFGAAQPSIPGIFSGRGRLPVHTAGAAFGTAPPASSGNAPSAAAATPCWDRCAVGRACGTPAFPSGKGPICEKSAVPLQDCAGFIRARFRLP